EEIEKRRLHLMRRMARLPCGPSRRTLELARMFNADSDEERGNGNPLRALDGGKLKPMNALRAKVDLLIEATGMALDFLRLRPAIGEKMDQLGIAQPFAKFAAQHAFCGRR